MTWTNIRPLTPDLARQLANELDDAFECDRLFNLLDSGTAWRTHSLILGLLLACIETILTEKDAG
jgi:hypothetical protein